MIDKYFNYLKLCKTYKSQRDKSEKRKANKYDGVINVPISRHNENICHYLYYYNICEKNLKKKQNIMYGKDEETFIIQKCIPTNLNVSY